MQLANWIEIGPATAMISAKKIAGLTQIGDFFCF